MYVESATSQSVVETYLGSDFPPGQLNYELTPVTGTWSLISDMSVVCGLLAGDL